MGIEQFFSSIEENNITNLKSDFSKTLHNQLDADYFFMDFNSVIYITNYKVLFDLNSILYKIITNKTSHAKTRVLIDNYDLTVDDHTTPKSFSEFFTEDTLHTIIIDRVVKYIINACTRYLNPDRLRLLYIALDGTPSKAKMVEQRKRRYMGAFAIGIKQKIFDKHEDELKKNNNRYLFEKYKINWKTHNITPGTKFMFLLHNTLTSSDFEISIKKKCKRLESYIFSGPYEPGEGENKIVNYIRNTKIDQSNYLIYSPDTDVTLLALLLHSDFQGQRVNNIKLLRQNQQKNSYDVVDIAKLSQNIFAYVLKHTAVADQHSVINDIVFILTIFGNDFVPKIESVSVRLDFNRIIDLYIDLLKSNKENFLIQYSHHTKRRFINQSFFVQLFHKLQTDEGGNLQRVYMSSHYQNYNRLKRLLGADHTNFTLVFNEFLQQLRNFNTTVRKSNPQTIDNILATWTRGDKNKFISTLKRITRLNRTNDNNEFILSFIEHFKRQNKLPFISITFRPYTKTINDSYHVSKIEKSLDHIDSTLPITSYDKELYQFERMLDMYAKKMNSTPLNLGYIAVDPRTFTFKTEKIITGVKRYYNDFFYISNITDSNPKMQSLVQHYLDGLVWVFEYYFNDYDEVFHRNNANTWFYPYTHSPLLTQTFNYLKFKSSNDPNFISNISSRLKQYFVSRNQYFTCLEHLMYVSPVKIMKGLAPPEYIPFTQTSKHYPDMSSVVDNVWNHVSSDEVDCRGVIFSSKCHLKVVHHTRSFEHDKSFIAQLRKIKLGPESSKRNCIFDKSKPNIQTFTYKPFAPLDQISDQEFSHSEHSHKNMYHQYKSRYLQTGNYKYKQLYKQYKHLSSSL